MAVRIMRHGQEVSFSKLAGFPSCLHFESTMKGSNPKIHTPSDTFDYISMDRVVEFIKVAIGFATEMSQFQETAPGSPTPAPDAAKLYFPSAGQPRTTGTLKANKQVTISYEMSRMSKMCDTLKVCWKVGIFGSKSCKAISSSQANEFQISVASAGNVYFTFESVSASGTCASDSPNPLGYQFVFE